MKKMKIWRILFVMLAAFSIASCSSVDGDEDPMEWRTEAKIKREGYYSIVNLPATGSDYSFTCTNYRGFHFDACKVNGRRVEVNDEGVDGLTKIEGEWFSIEKENNVFRIEVLPNQTGDAREIVLDVWSGNTSTFFHFKQASVKDVEPPVS